MVAIFAGAGFGFERGSASVLGGTGLLGDASLGRGSEGVYVNAATGNLLLQKQDEYLVGKGPDDTIARTYNSLTNLADDNNDHWRQSTDRRVYGLTGTLNTAGSTVKRVSGDGAEITYTWDASRSAYVTTDGGGAYDTLVKSGANWVWTDGDTLTTETYDGTTTRILNVTDINGNALTFAYDGSGRLSTVTTANGEWTRYDWSGSTQNITQIVTGYTDLATGTARTLTRTRYGYDGSNRLTTVTVDLSPEDNAIADGKTYVTTYTYDGSGRVSNIAQSDGSNLAIAFDGSGRVQTLTETASSGVTRVTSLAYGTGYTSVTDPAGQVTRLDYEGAAGSAPVISDLSVWGLSNVSRAAAGTIAGAPAYQFTQTAPTNSTAYAASPAPFFVNAGEIVTFDITLMGVGIYTSDALGFLGYNSGWGTNGETTATVVSGPGALNQFIGGNWGVTGLSTTQATTIRLTRTFTQSEYINAWVMPDYGTGNRYGASVIVASPTFAKAAAGTPIRLTKITAPAAYAGAAQQIVQFGYTANGDLTSVTDALGKVTVYSSFTANGMAQTVTDPLSNVVTRTFDARNKVLSETHIGVDATGAAVSQTSRFVYDAAGNLRYAISAEGRVSEWTWYQGANNSAYEYTDNVYTTAGTPTEAQMNTWKSGLGVTDRITATYYGYDARKNLTSTQTMGLTDTNSGYVGSEGLTQRTFVYDQAGHLLKSQDSNRNVETYVYDGMGRLIASTDINGGSTTYVFNDAATTTTVTMASGYVVTRTYNKAGELISVTDSGANTTVGTTQYAYDKLGRVRVRTDAVSSLKTYTIYDSAGRHVGDVDSAGMLTEYRYDADNRLVGTVQYHTAISGANLTNLGSESTWNVPIATLRPSTSTQDTASWVVYDANGRVIETIAGDGSATISTYDASGHLLQTTAYYNKVAAATVAGYITGSAPTALVTPTADPAKDIVARNFYDKDGNLIGRLDGEGYLSQNTYDKAGRLITASAYATQVAQANRASSSFNTLIGLVGTSVDDRVTHNVYDARGLLRYKLDDVMIGGVARNLVTAFTYNDIDKIAKQVVFDTAITPPSYNLAAVNTAVSALTGNTNNRTSYFVYDAAERLTFSVDPAGTVTGFTYNTMGAITKSIQFADAWTGGDPYLNGGAWASWTSTSAGHASNRTARTFYTARGEAAYTVDAEGFVSLNGYDANGQLVQTTRWTNAIAVNDSTTFAQVAAAVASSGGTTKAHAWQYDSLGRVTIETDGLSATTSYTYHGTTSLVNTVTRAANGTSQEQAVSTTTFDAAGRAIQSVDGTSAGGDGAVNATGSVNYDGRGLVSSSVDARGATTSYTYDLDGRVKTVTNALGGITSYEYNAFGQAWKVTDPNGGVTYTWYDRLGRVIGSRDGENYLTTTSYTVFGEIASVTRYMTAVTGTPVMGSVPAGTGTAATTSFTYDKAGRVLTSVDALNQTESYSYDILGNRLTRTNKLGAVTTYTYDRRGLLLTESVAAPTTRYDAAGNAVSTGASIVTRYDYDSWGNRKKTYEAYGLAEQRTTTYTYNANNQLTRVDHDAVSTIGDDMVTVANNVAVAEKYTYDKRGNVVLALDAADAATYSYYDDLDRRTAEIRQVGTGQWVYTAYTYDANGNLTSTRVYEANGYAGTPPTGGNKPAAPAGAWRQTDFAYDGLNRMSSSTVIATTNDAIVSGTWNGTSYVSNTGAGAAAQGLTTTYQYDAAGNVVKMTDPRGSVTLSWYDLLGRKTAQVDAEKYLTTWNYNAEGSVTQEYRYTNKVGTQDGLVPTTTTTRQALINSSWYNLDDRFTDFTYDLNGNRLSEQRYNVVAWNGSGGTTTGVSTITYTYNALGQVLAKTVAGAQIASYTYENTGRLLSESRASFTDVNGVTGVTPTTSYQYDALGNLSRTLQAGAGGTFSTLARVTTYTYGAGGRLAGTRDAEGFTHTYSYDVMGRLRKDAYDRRINADTLVSSSTVTTVAEAQTKTYDMAGRVLAQAIYSTVGGTFQRLGYTSYAYNNFDQVVSQGTGSNSASGMNAGAALFQVTNKYDAAGRLTGTNAGDGVWKFFGYDALGNQTASITSAGTAFTESTGFSGALAQVGSATVNGTFTVYDKRNMATQVVEEGRDLSATVSGQTLTTSRSYTAFGEVASETNAALATVIYTYNTMGRLIRSESPAVEMTDETGASYWVKPAEEYYYDAAGRRVATRDANGTYGTTTNTQATAYSKAANTGNLTQLVLLAGTGYDNSQALVTSEIHADGSIKTVLYDIMGDARVVRDELYNASSPNLHQSENTYNRLGQLTQAKHNRATNGSDDSTRLVDDFLLDQSGQRIQHWNNQLGSSVIEKSAVDALGRITSQTDFAGYVTTTTYTWDGTLNTSIGGANVNLGGFAETVTYSGNARQSITKTDIYNHEVYKKDLGDNGGHVFTATYDAAGRMTSRTTGSASQTYTWYNTGQLLSVTAPNGTESYTYDAVGNRLTELLVADGNTIKSAQATYDALGRLTYWNQDATSYVNTWFNKGLGNQTTVTFTSPRAYNYYSYDAAGNVRRTESHHYAFAGDGTPSTYEGVDTAWFRYDAMNRLVVDKGMLSGTAGDAGTTIVRATSNTNYSSAGSQEFVYDAAGQRIASIRTDVTPGSFGFDYYGQLIYNPGTWVETRENYDYDGAGHLADIRITQGWAESESVTYDPSTYTYTITPPSYVWPAPVTGGVNISVFTYDLMGRQTSQSDYNSSGSQVVFSRLANYGANGRLESENSWTLKSDNKTYSSSNSYVFTDSVTGEYLLGAVGSVTGSTSVSGSSSVTYTRTKNTYQWWDSAQQGTINYRTYSSYSNFAADTSPSTTYNTTFTYDGLGTLGSVKIVDGRPRYVWYRSDGSGQIVRRDEADYNQGPGYESARSGDDPHEQWYRFGGRELGYVGNNGTNAMTAQASVSDRQVVDGTSNGAFRHASTYGTNGSEFSQGSSPINAFAQGSAAGSYTVSRAGETLRSVAQNVYGDASLWYKIAEANGMGGDMALAEGQRLSLPAGITRSHYNASTLKPYDANEAIGNVSPTTPKPNKKGCGVLGMILIAVIAIAATIVTAGAFISAAGAAPGGLLGGMQAFLGIGTASIGASASLGLSAGMMAVTAGAVGGAVGSAVSQGVAIAAGIQDKFSWSGVALGAIGGGIGGAIAPGGALGGPNGLFSGIGSSTGAQIAAAGLRAAAGSALSQGIGVATGLQSKFDFVGVAAAGIGGLAGSFVGSRVGESFGGVALSAGASMLANAATRSALDGSNFGDNIMAALPDVIAGLIQRAVGTAMDGVTRARPRRFIDANGDELIDGGTVDPKLVTEGQKMAERMIAASSEILPSGTGIALADAGAGVPIDLPGDQAGRLPSDSDVLKEIREIQDALNSESKSGSEIPGWLKWIRRGSAFILLVEADPLGGTSFRVPVRGMNLSIGISGDTGDMRLISNDKRVGSLERGDLENIYFVDGSDGRPAVFDNGVNAFVIRSVGEFRVGFGVTIQTRREAEIFNDGISSGLKGEEIQGLIDNERINSGPPAGSYSPYQIRYAPGTAFSSGELQYAGPDWLKSGGATPVPRQIAAKLWGEKFGSFDEFREAFWKTVAGDDNLVRGFRSEDVWRMQQGWAPRTDVDQRYKGQKSYVIHHNNAIARGGAVYDMSNMLIVTPRWHNGYHYGK